jgi:hypothetical protein
MVQYLQRVIYRHASDPGRGHGLRIDQQNQQAQPIAQTEMPSLARPTDVVGFQGVRCQELPSCCHMSLYRWNASE